MLPSWNLTIASAGKKGAENMNWYWIALIALGGVWALTILMYWFNLDNKMIYYVVRPMLYKIYSKQKRDVKL